MDRFLRKLIFPECLLEEQLRRFLGEKRFPRNPQEYSLRLGACLRRKGGFTEEEITEQVSLVEDHLHDSMQERRAAGLSEQEAWQQTLEAFGTIGEAAGGCNPIAEFAVMSLPLTLVVGIPVFLLIRGELGMAVAHLLLFLFGIAGGFGILLRSRVHSGSQDKLFFLDSLVSLFFWKSVLFCREDFTGWRLLCVAGIRLLVGGALVGAIILWTVAWSNLFASVEYISHPFIGVLVGTVVILHGLASSMVSNPLLSLLVRIQLVLERRLFG